MEDIFGWSEGDLDDLNDDRSDISEGANTYAEDASDSDSDYNDAQETTGSNEDTGTPESPDQGASGSSLESEQVDLTLLELIETEAFSGGFDSQNLVVSQLVDTLNAANAPPVSEINPAFDTDFSNFSSENPGEIHLDPENGLDLGTSPVYLSSFYTISGNGTIQGNLISDATLSPGNSPGVINLPGGTVLGSGSNTIIEIEGPAGAGLLGGFDQVQVAGSITLGGSLTVQVDPSYTPAAGDSFEVVTFTSSTGAFQTFSGQQLAGGFFLQPTLSSTGLTLTVIEGQSGTPERPLILVPGFGGSFAADDSVADWFSTRGLSPDKLQIDPLGGTYDDLIATLDAVGYTPESDLFIANWDWRLSVAPSPAIVNDANDVDGVISGPDVTAAKLTDNEFKYGIDYLGYALKEAFDQWVSDHGVAPESVDVITL